MRNAAGMSLRNRTASIVVFVFLLLTLGLYGVFSTVLMGEFERIEESHMKENLERVLKALKNDQSQLVVKTEDWAKWDDTYQYMEDRNEKYQGSVLNYETVASLKMDHLVYFDRKGKLFDGYEINTQEEKTIPVTEEFIDSLSIGEETKVLATPETMPTGFIKRGNEVLIFASVPIMDSSRSQPIRGALFSTHIVTSDFINAIADQTQLDVQMFAVGQEPPQLAPVLQELQGSGAVLTKPISEEQISSWGLVKDIHGVPVLVCQVTAPRRVYEQGLATRNLVMLCSLVAGLLATGAILLALNRWIISRLAQLQREVNQMDRHGNSICSVTAEGNDELSALAKDINLMLEGIYLARMEILQARDAEQAANAAKSRFIAKVSHELRTPIHSVLGLLRLVRKRLTDVDLKGQVGMARDATLGLLGVVNDILDFSKSEVGQLSVRAEPCDVRTSVREALRLIAPRIFERGESEPIECVAEISDSVPELIVVDGKRITQILVNYLGNAVKFTKRGSIQVFVNWREVSPGQGTLECSVRDSGIGIPEDKLALVFEPFKQVDDSVSRQYQGTGLGLAIVKQLVNAMQGTVAVRSEFGKGSEFSFEIPVAVGAGSTASAVKTFAGAAVWVINNSDLESERLCACLKNSNAIPTPTTTAALRQMNVEQIPIGEIDYLVIAGNCLVSHRSWSLLKNFVEQRGPDRVVILVSPHELSYREQLRAIGVKKIVLTPIVTQDVAKALTGDFEEDFSGYDDFVDILPDQGSSLEILVADDLLTNQLVLKCMLQDMGHKVTVVNNGQELLDSLGATLGLREFLPSDKRFDIVMTDLQMPILDGMSALRRIREIEAEHEVTFERRLPVFLVTAHALEDEQGKMIAAGASAVVTKPIDIKDLEAKLKHFSGRRDVPDKSTVEGLGGIIECSDDLMELLNELVRNATQTSAKGDISSSEDFFDLSRLKKHMGQDLGRGREFIGAYRITLESLKCGLDGSIGSGSTSELEKIAHSLKGCLGELGCSSASSLASSLVNECRKNPASFPKAGAEELARSLSVIKSILDRANSSVAV